MWGACADVRKGTPTFWWVSHIWENSPLLSALGAHGQVQDEAAGRTPQLRDSRFYLKTDQQRVGYLGKLLERKFLSPQTNQSQPLDQET
jgi:hypothetical protein